MSGSNQINRNFNKITANNANINELTINKLTINNLKNVPTDSPFKIGDKFILNKVEFITITNELSPEYIIVDNSLPKHANVDYGEILFKDVIYDNYLTTIYICKYESKINNEVFQNIIFRYNKLDNGFIMSIKGVQFKYFVNNDFTKVTSTANLNEHKCFVEEWEVIKA